MEAEAGLRVKWAPEGRERGVAASLFEILNCMVYVENV